MEKQRFIEQKFIQFCRDLKKELVPKKTNLPKIRIGEKGDGGYVICDTGPSTGLYSYGCDDNIKFEKAYHEKYGGHCWVFDHTINGITDCPDYITFIKEGVGPNKEENLDRIDNQISPDHDCSTMMVQMDVEGYEWITLQFSEKIKQFAQVIVEFHMNCGVPSEIKLETLKFMNEHFVLVHIHGNNCPLQPWFDINLPVAFECTYVRKDLVTSAEPDHDTLYPIKGLDFPNSPDFPDLPLNWWQGVVEGSL